MYSYDYYIAIYFSNQSKRTNNEPSNYFFKVRYMKIESLVWSVEPDYVVRYKTLTGNFNFLFFIIIKENSNG